MRLTIVTSALAFACATFASQDVCTDDGPTTSKPFNVMSIHSGSGVHYAGWAATLNRLVAGTQHQNASCDRGEDNNSATFYINDGSLYLFARSATPQEAWVDRSGMGQGIMGYTTGAQPPPRNAERKGWSIDENDHLLFGGNSFMACPGTDGWNLWADTGNPKPGYQDDCVGIAARVLPNDNPVSCLYSQQGQ
ncbi:hypothetical protein KEM52_005170 [Ascosphaera acerosa]|nr:hypothetical protein KEM52_005170 [Ascosphaera acerosa]